MSQTQSPAPRGLVARLPQQFVLFVFVSGVAAAMNFGSRIAFSRFMPYTPAIVLAFCVGLSAAFVLGRLFVFRNAAKPLHQQMLYFVLVNLFGLAQTVLISLLLARWLLPALGMTAHIEELAHAVGIAVPIISSYFGHKYLSFAQAPR